jgi:hypothetical protein
MGWVWQSSRSKGTDRLVLLAVADCASDDGGNAFPSMAALVAKTGLTDRGIQKAMIRLKHLGELKVFPNAGPRGCNRYKVVMSTPERGSPPNVVHPEPRSGIPERGSPLPPNHVHPPPERGSPGTVLEPSDEPSWNQKTVATATVRTPAQRSKAITDAYHRAEPMSKWPAVNAIVLKAIKVGRWPDDEIRDALLRLAEDHRSVTVDTLRVELTGPPASSRASPGYVERNGARLKPETAANLDRRAHFQRLDAARAAEQDQLAIGGSP